MPVIDPPDPPARPPRGPRHSRWNAAGIIATLAGCAVAWGGLIYAPMRPLYDYAWFVGFGVGGAVYLAFGRRRSI